MLVLEIAAGIVLALFLVWGFFFLLFMGLAFLRALIT